MDTGFDRAAGLSRSRPRALRVPEITVFFWIIKGLSTALGESTSDYLVHAMNPVVAVGLGFVGFVIALLIQFSRRRYVAGAYWFAVVMVGVFGTMAADVLHVGFHVPYIASTALYAIVLVSVFVLWARTERTLSIHSIDRPRRELFYWAAVVATFAMGTALGDLSAFTFHLGFLHSLVLFAVVILIPALGFRFLRWGSIFSFWFAYVVTRPLGASFADWVGKPKTVGGLGYGDGPVTAILGILIVVLVIYLAITRIDVQADEVALAGAAGRAGLMRSSGGPSGGSGRRAGSPGGRAGDLPEPAYELPSAVRVIARGSGRLLASSAEIEAGLGNAGADRQRQAQRPPIAPGSEYPVRGPLSEGR